MIPQVSPWVLLAAAFFIGSIPFGLWIARLFQKGDLRTQGSGNIGATNVSRVAGFWPAGFLTFLFDMLKGFVPAALVAHSDLGKEAWAVGAFAVLGHCYSPWLRLKGGKGVSTSFGVFLALSPWAAFAGFTAFAAFFAYSRIGSLASISGILAAAGMHLVLYPADRNLWFLLAIVFIVLIRHESNIDALLHGRERVFGEKK